MKTRIHRKDQPHDVIRAVQILLSVTPYELIITEETDDTAVIEIRESTWEFFDRDMDLTE